MGYQVGATCYGTALQAAQASASSQAGAVISRGTQTYVVNVTGVDETTIHYRLEPIGAGVAFAAPIPYNAQPCGLLEWQDGLALGWGVATAWILTAAVMHLRRAAHQ